MRATSDGLLRSPSEHLLRPMIPIADLSIEAAKDNCVMSLVEQAVLLGSPIEFGLEVVACGAKGLRVLALQRCGGRHDDGRQDEQQKTQQFRCRNREAVNRLGDEVVVKNRGNQTG